MQRWGRAVGAAGVALVLAAAPAKAQRGELPPDVRDSLVLRLVAYRAPCPDPVPPHWSMGDSTLAMTPRCNLVEAAARLVRDQLRSRRVPRSEGADPWKPLCVRLYETENSSFSAWAKDWMVVFDLTPTLVAEVMIDRRSGAPMFALLGDGTRRLGQACLTR